MTNPSIPPAITENKKKIEALQTVDGQALLLADLPPIRFTVEGLLPQGLFILAGSPKVGKSWLSLMLSQHVAAGTVLWGRDVPQGTVLYLALEDSLVRLQTRYRRYSEDGTPALHFAIRARTIRDGLVAQIGHFITRHPDTRLVIIDTMQHVRDAATDKNCYVNDYNDMNMLRQITSAHDITLLLVTHTRKQDDADPLNRISGSTGLVGAVDGVFILEKEERTSNKGRLTIANRDTDGHVFLLEFGGASCRWELVEEKISDHREEPLLAFLASFLGGKKEWMGTATELCKAAEEHHTAAAYTPATIAKTLRANDQKLFSKYGIEARHSVRDNVKTIRLTKTQG
ncbi:helicase RepA family protein [Ruminococcaceae bacterium OttesenSCG-928-D13]|nr:helicase RepA family protein [Ruminococcaceae bacterium OttesenSCG-928-D13]